MSHTITILHFPHLSWAQGVSATPHGAKGGGIPHGVLPEMGPGGSAGQLTEHRPRWTGTHETVQPPPDTMQKRNKAQTDTEARQGAGAASTALARPNPVESKHKGGKRGNVSWAPDLAKDVVSESVSDSVSDSLTAHLDPVTDEAQDQAVVTVNEPEAQQARKFPVDATANRETARPRRESAGEQRLQMEIFQSTSKQTTKKLFTPHKIFYPDFTKNINERFPLVKSVLQGSTFIFTSLF
ncbi:uncharacterized protein LOC115025341 [Cottoperca gobio]|uniref:Uncharacterized protein LOC115025341 n=1 Tax=Cottoperca gobio TaxID=56716 RepID=A0A6J2RQX5_COTGO|nr:uncharacterized protein LOC115025341 [Cottoperca gobio]